MKFRFLSDKHPQIQLKLKKKNFITLNSKPREFYKTNNSVAEVEPYRREIALSLSMIFINIDFVQ